MSLAVQTEQREVQYQTEPSRPAKQVGRVAYLVNQYPLPSSTFIRREIEALERLGVDVYRFSVRQARYRLKDPKDLIEASKTKILLELGATGLILAVLRVFLKRPVSLMKATALAVKTGYRSDRGLLCNLIYLAEACELLNHLVADEIQHLHVHYGTNSTSVAMLCRQLGGPEYSFTSHGPDEFDKPEFLKIGEKVARSKFAVAISDFGRSQIYRWTDHKHWHKVHVVHCGLDQEFLDAPVTDFPLEPRLLFIGRLSEQKGTQLLVEAANQLKEEGLEFELVLVGDGPMRSELERLIKAYGLDDNVILAGWKNDAEVRQAIRDSRALVMASFAEGLPVVIMESLSMGRPVLSTNVAGVAELVKPGETGWLVPAGSVAGLAAAMREVLELPIDELAEFGRIGSMTVTREHNAMIEAAKLLELMDLDSPC